jgi:hypothetical protein
MTRHLRKPAEYLARSPHWAHLMRLTKELGMG